MPFRFDRLGGTHVPTLPAVALAVLATGTLSPHALAQSATSAEPVTLAEMVVTGEQPGPGLWRIGDADGDGVVWVLGTVSPLPVAIDWNAAEVQRVLADAHAVIAPPAVQMDVGAGDVFKMATLVRSAKAAMKLPDGRTLRDVLTPEQFGRWSELRAQYLPDGEKVERLRPLFASQDLYYGAIDASGLTRADIVWTRVSQLAESAGVPLVDTQIVAPLAIDRKAYRAGIRELAESRIDEVTCFERTTTTLTSELRRMVVEANAWSVGDIAVLSALTAEPLLPPCKPVYDRAMSFQSRPGLTEQAESRWREAVRQTLDSGQTALAVLPMSDLVGAKGALAAFERDGFEVVAPVP